MGLMKLLEGWKRSTDKGEKLAPIRATIVATALGQVGTIMAAVSSGQKEGDIPLRTGWQRFIEIHQQVHPEAVDTEQNLKDYKDSRVKIGPSGGNRVGSWCGIFALWVQNMAGNTSAKWSAPPFKIAGGGAKFTTLGPGEKPKPGDIVVFPGDSNHHATVVAVDGGTMTLVEANFPEEISGILVTERQVSSARGFYRAVARSEEI
jgi:hypothetical protein